MNKIILMIGTWLILFILSAGFMNGQVGEPKSLILEILIVAVLISTAITFLIWGWFL